MSAGEGRGTRDVSAPGMAFALTRLVSGKADAIAFVEVGPDAVAVQALEVDARGVPVLRREAGHSVPWTAILPELPVPAGLRHERMAGEIDAVPGGVSVGETIGPKLELLAEVAATGGRPDGTPRRLDIVLVNRANGWPLLEAAAARARAVLRPITEVTAAPRAGPLPEVIHDLAVRAPLRYAYDLIVIEVDENTREVRPQVRELFPIGASVLPGGGVPPDATVTLSPVTGHSAAVLALPIVARRGPIADWRDVAALAEQRPLITMATIGAGAGGPVELRVGLTGPGRPSILAPAELRLAAAALPGWPGVIEELPGRLPPKNPPWLLSPLGDLDLAVLVELGGTSADVATRVGLARGVVRKFRGVTGARIGVLGYRDHYGGYRDAANCKRGQEDAALVIGCCRLTDQGEAASTLVRPAWWDAVPIGHPHAAPVEDALVLLTAPTWGWRPDTRRVIVVIGRRPPHPARLPARAADIAPHGFDLRPCHYGYSWEEALGQLRKEHAVDCYAVLDRPPAPGYDAQAWQDFAERGCFQLGRDSLRQLAGAFGLAPPPRVHLRLAMLGAASSPSASKGPAGRARR